MPWFPLIQSYPHLSTGWAPLFFGVELISHEAWWGLGLHWSMKRSVQTCNKMHRAMPQMVWGQTHIWTMQLWFQTGSVYSLRRPRSRKPRHSGKIHVCSIFHASHVATMSIEADRIAQAGSQWTENTVDPVDFVIIYNVLYFVYICALFYCEALTRRTGFNHGSVRLSNNKADFTLHLEL